MKEMVILRQLSFLVLRQDVKCVLLLLIVASIKYSIIYLHPTRRLKANRINKLYKIRKKEECQIVRIVLQYSDYDEGLRKFFPIFKNKSAYQRT